MADDIEREALKYQDEPNTVTTMVIHTIMWGIADLNLDGLIVKLMRIVNDKS